MTKINDSVFGEMSFYCGWVKNEAITFWNRSFIPKIVADADEDEPISEEQRKSYVNFKNNIAEISSKTEKLVFDRLNEDLDDISETTGKAVTAEELFNQIKLTSVIFYNSGRTVLICDTDWDEAGIGLEVYPNYAIGSQDMFL